jgi:hypothetical protein
MTETGDAIAETRRAAKKCAECGEPTTIQFLDPFDKAKDRPLCLACLGRKLTGELEPEPLCPFGIGSSNSI